MRFVNISDENCAMNKMNLNLANELSRIVRSYARIFIAVLAIFVIFIIGSNEYEKESLRSLSPRFS